MRTGLVLVCCLISVAPVFAEDSADKKEQEKASAEVQPVVTEHSAMIDGEEVRYTATAGKLTMKTDVGDEKAQIFYIAYTVNNKTAPQLRPLTFCFNGGPGSSSVWLQLGMLGPRRVMFPEDATLLRPPYRLHANPHSLLDVTDLVFIDPVSTGYSRPAKDEKKDQFHGYDEDIRSVAQFIHDYTTRNERWLSPKLVLGESYGGTRAAGLAGHPRERYRMELNGVVLVSAVTDFQTIRFASNNDLPYVLFLPTYAATAHYHSALPGDLQQQPLEQVVAAAEKFATDEYSVALLKGASLAEAERNAIVEKLSRFTGLSKDYIEGSNLRVPMHRFGKELLRKRQQTVGRFDSRYTGVDRDNVGEAYDFDASGAAIFGPFTALFNDYVRRELEYKEDRVYEILTGNVHPWSFGRFENRYVDAAETLREAMAANPYLQVFVAAGYYDLATPHFAMDYTLDHMPLPADRRKNVTTYYYEGGHMMYIHEPSMVKLRKDLVELYASIMAI